MIIRTETRQHAAECNAALPDGSLCTWTATAQTVGEVAQAARDHIDEVHRATGRERKATR